MSYLFNLVKIFLKNRWYLNFSLTGLLSGLDIYTEIYLRQFRQCVFVIYVNRNVILGRNFKDDNERTQWPKDGFF